MTKDEINRKLAEKVMGWHLVCIDIGDKWFDDNNNIKIIGNWNPYENISQAFEVVERIEMRGYYFKLTHWCELEVGFRWVWIATFVSDSRDTIFEEKSETATEAICNAAIEASEEA